MRYVGVAAAVAPRGLPEKIHALRICGALHKRKNWVFHHQVHGAEASARLYGIIATARANEIGAYHEADMPWDNLLSLPETRDYAATTDIAWGLEQPPASRTTTFTPDGFVERLRYSGCSS